MSEIIAYKRNVLRAERYLLESYLGARWNIPNYTANDKYSGDDTAKGNYDFHVGGIGRESTGNSTPGTSLGLKLSNSAFLNADGTYLLAGLNNLTPLTDTVTSDISDFVVRRSKRIWYLDKTGSSTGSVEFQFNTAASALNFSIGATETVVLLYRAADSGNFSELSTGTVSGSTATIT